jgi:Protein of unknown function (DUF992)
MNRCLSMFTALTMAVAVVMPTSVRATRIDRTKVGTLSCDISAGMGIIIASKKYMTCMFTPAQPGPREVYAGSITKFGLDIGSTAGGEMIWAVYAPTNRRFGALAGHYVGASAEATVGGGVGANVLVGGSNRTVSLQPVSLQGQARLNVAAGVAGLELRPAR